MDVTCWVRLGSLLSDGLLGCSHPFVLTAWRVVALVSFQMFFMGGVVGAHHDSQLVRIVLDSTGGSLGRDLLGEAGVSPF